MSRMWDKGDPLDKQVLAYTAGDGVALAKKMAI